MVCILITGPSRSGKSEWAEALAERMVTANAQQVVYIATAQTNPDDAEWQQRIEQHRRRRPESWQVQEVPLALDEAILFQTGSANTSRPETDCLLIDSLGTWLANLIELEDDAWLMVQQALLRSLMTTAATVILVAEETGWGVVPAYELGRRFRDRLGTLSRAVGEISSDVYLVTSGYALNIAKLGEAVGTPNTSSVLPDDV